MLGKFQPIGHLTYLRHYLEASKVFRTKLFVLPLLYRNLPVRLQLDRNPLPRLKGPVSPVGISLLFHPILCPLQLRFQQFNHIFPLSQGSVHHFHICFFWQVGQMDGRRYSIYCFVRSHLYGGVEGGILPPLSQWDPLAPPLRLLKTHATEVSLKTYIHNPVCPSICEQ